MLTASASGSRLWVKASPRGTRSGFAVLPDGAGGRVTDWSGGVLRLDGDGHVLAVGDPALLPQAVALLN